MNRTQRWLAALAAVLICLLALPLASSGESAYRTLGKGDKGEDVLLLKQRMRELGYFSTDKLSSEYNDATAERVKDLQRKNGLTADGVASAELQALIFSDDCLGLYDTPYVSHPDSRTGMPEPAGPDAPVPEEDGYLPEGSEPYVFADRYQGAWTYLSRDIRVEIRQYTDPAGPHIWLVAMIRVRDPALFTAMVNTGGKSKSGTFLSMPDTIAKKNDAVFACSDDFFGYRIVNRHKVGIVIRNGRIWSDTTRVSTSKNFPPLDVIAVFDDGHMQTFDSDAHTAQEYLDMGVVSTYAFGPILVRDGQVCDDLQRWSSSDRNPRMAMGITAEGTVVILNALGRRKDARGVTFPWLAEKMLACGAVEALNLDGGNTTCMMFMGEIINRPANVRRKDLRAVNSVIGVREAEAPGTDQP